MAEEWLIRPPTSLATAMARLASPATMTVPVDSPPSPPPSSPFAAASTSRASLARACSVVGAGCVMRHRCPGGARVMRRERDVAPSGPRRGPGRRDGAAQLSGGTPPGRDAVRRTAVSSHADEVDDEDQCRARLDDPTGTTIAVGLVRRDGQPAAAAYLHAGDALVPALDHHADAQPELQRVAAVPGGVELLAAVVRDADVVRADQAAGGRLRSVTDDDVLDHEVLRGGPGRGLDVRSAQLGHGSPSCPGALPAPHPSKQRPRRAAQTRSTG